MALTTSAPLVEVKLAPPFLRREVLPRTSLLHGLMDPHDERVVSIVAPPGYGKTTLLGLWRSRERRPVAWLTLDEGDADPIRLFTYLATAIDRAVGVDPSLPGLLSGPDVPVLATIVPRLASSLQHDRRRLVVILDDVYLLAGSPSIDALAMLLDYLPHGVRVAVAGRTDAGLPMARFRAAGRLLELTAADLALDEDEAARLLTLDGWTPAPEDVRRLHGRTEGWPAALYLAGRAAAAGAQTRALPGDGADEARTATPTGATGAIPGRAAIAAYLDAELISAVDPTTRDFLVRTSLLTRMTGELCDAVVGREGSGALLRELAATNRLVTQIEGDASWYRYHSLLREHLHRLLDDEGGAAALHRRAAEWLMANGDAETAIDHVFAAGDLDAAAALFTAIALPIWREGRAATVVRWLDHFDDDWIRHHPFLGVMAAWVMCLDGRAAEAERMADLVHGATYGASRPAAAVAYEAAGAAVRAMMARRGLDAALADAEASVALVPRSNPWFVTCQVVLGAILCVTGDSERADSILDETAEMAVPLHATRAGAWACSWRALLAIERGDWAAAAGLVREALEWTGRLGVTNDVAVAGVAVVAARVDLHRGSIMEAKRHLAAFQAARTALSVGMPWFSGRFLLEAARVYLALGDPAGARTLLHQAEEIVRRRPELGSLPADIAALRARMADLPPGPAGASTLTPAELRVLRYLPTYLSTAEIATRLFVAPSTIKTQIQAIYGKLGATSRAEAVEHAIEVGLLEPLPILAGEEISTS